VAPVKPLKRGRPRKGAPVLPPSTNSQQVDETPVKQSRSKILNKILDAALSRQACTLLPLPEDIDEVVGKRIIDDLVRDEFAHGGRYPNLTPHGRQIARSRKLHGNDAG